MNHQLLSAFQGESAGHGEGGESPLPLALPRRGAGEEEPAATAAATEDGGGGTIDPASTAALGDVGPPPFSASHGLFSRSDRENSGEEGTKENGSLIQNSVPLRGVAPSDATMAGEVEEDNNNNENDASDEGAARREERQDGDGGSGHREQQHRHDSVKRRKLRRMVASGYPSFHLLLSANYDNSDDETPDNDNVPVAALPADGTVSSSEPARPGGPMAPAAGAAGSAFGAGSSALRPIYIDVDEEIGLKPRRRRSERRAADAAAPNKRAASAGARGPEPHPLAAVSAADQGYYEGAVAVSLPEDEAHLSELHCWTRRQLEYFSATRDDVRSAQSGGGGRRGAPLVAGRVGLRCRHCRAAREGVAPAATATATGAVSYPLNLTGVYAACSQKPSLHFESHCPGLPEPERRHLQALLGHHQGSAHPSSGSGRRGWAGGGGTNPGSIPTLTYYVVSAKRLGIVEVGEGQGLRFGRDLALEPLPLEATTRLEEASAETAAGTLLADDESILSGGPGSSHNEPDSITSVAYGASGGLKGAEARIVADEESEQVLAEAVLEPDDPEKRPGRVHDKGRVTDFYFLMLRQMAITHAAPIDFAGKGKKTRLMRVGFAGFCCRHCSEPDVLWGGGCRSFSSAADNLPSSMSNSFALHLQKCHKVPPRIKKALSAYKRLHQRQLAQLPYGSQRRLIHDLWSRLRASDVTEEEMNERIQLLQPPPVKGEQSLTASTAVPPRDSSSPTASASSLLLPQVEVPQGRPELFPECNDEETQQVLQRAMEVWDPAENDFLLLPEERWLITDFLFLTMRQLKAAFMDGPSTHSGRRSTKLTAGLRCMHCMNQDPRQQLVSPSGRSFPSAPDNFASSMNSSFYSHMQACPFVPADIRRALFNTKKLHSTQCSNLKFGSQRRFFNLLFNRLKSLNRADFAAGDGGEMMEDGATSQVQNDLLPAEPTFPESITLGFVALHASNAHQRLWGCVHCRMVPLPLRAPGSCFTEASSTMVDEMKAHRAVCVGDSFHLDIVANALKDYVSKDHPQLPRDTALQSESFENFVISCVSGSPELLHVFLHDVVHLVITTGDDDIGMQVKQTLPDMLQRSRGLWAKFPHQVDAKAVLDRFHRFAMAHDLSPSLIDHPNLVKFMMCVAPGLSLTGFTFCEPTESMDEAIET